MDEQQWMQPLTAHIRALVAQQHFSEAEDEAAQAMAAAPHDAQPHNLMGIIVESRNDHVQAMKHFRAAWALDPTYRPARNVYHTPNVICRLYDPEREIVYKEFGIDTICPTVLSTREIDRLLGKAKEAKEA